MSDNFMLRLERVEKAIDAIVTEEKHQLSQYGQNISKGWIDDWEKTKEPTHNEIGDDQ